MNSYSQSQGGGFFTGGQGNANGGSRKDQKQSVRSVTIKQLTEATEPHPEAETFIDGVLAEKVKIVAEIREVIDKSTYVVYKVEDGTGAYEVRKWVDNVGQLSQQDIEMDGGEDESSNKLKAGDYVSIVGSIKVFNNSRSLNAHQIHVVKDFNEVIYHQLEALHTHLALTAPDGVKSNSNESGSLFVNDSKSLRELIIDIFRSNASAILTEQDISHRIPGHDEYDVHNSLIALESQGQLMMEGEGFMFVG